MRVFGAECYAHIPKQKSTKLDVTGAKCIFLGYEKHRKAYRLLKESDGSIITSRSVTFTEDPVVRFLADTTEDMFNIISDETVQDINNERNGDEECHTPPTRPCNEIAQQDKIDQVIVCLHVDLRLPEEMAKKSGWYVPCVKKGA